MKKIIMVYGVIFIIFSAVFIGLFHSPILSQQKVLFYRGIGLLALASILGLIIVIYLNQRCFKYRMESMLAALVMSICLNLTFFVIFPVTFDRSVTTYLLSKLNEKANMEKCGGLTEEKLESQFIKEYVKDNKAISRRFREQSVIKTITQEGECIKITTKGKSLLNFLELIKKIYSIK